MNMKRYSWILAAALAGTLALAGLLALAPRQTRAQSIHLQPEAPSVNAGERLRFAGHGFEPRERVDVWATDPQQGVVRGKYADADNQGYVTISFWVPVDAVGGQWVLTARGDRSAAPITVAFEVVGRAPQSETFQAKVAPPGGLAGTTFMFAATGFDTDERVSYWITDPNGVIFQSFHRGTEADDGRVDFSWTAPDDAQAGRWVMTMQGYDTNRARAVPFYIHAPGEVGTDAAPAATATTAPATDATAIPAAPVPDYPVMESPIPDGPSESDLPPSARATATPLPPTATPTRAPLPPQIVPSPTGIGLPLPSSGGPTDGEADTPPPPTATPLPAMPSPLPLPPTATPAPQPFGSGSSEATPAPPLLRPGGHNPHYRAP